MKKVNEKGFTLAELLIVVAVIAVLVAVAIPTFANQLEKSRQAVDVSNLRGAYAAAKLVAMDGKYVDNTGAVKALTAELHLYYDPNTGKLIDNTDAAKEKSAGGFKAGTSPNFTYGYNKSTSATTYADVSNLDTTVITTTMIAGQDKAAIQVTFAQDTTTGGWKVNTIAFVDVSSGTFAS